MRDLLVEDDEVLDAEVLPYLISMVDLEQEEVVGLLRPFLGLSDRWNDRAGWAPGRVRASWHTRAAVDLFKQLLGDAARIYAHNMNCPRSAFCARQLSPLPGDEEDAVRRLVGNALSNIRSVHSAQVRRLVEELAASRTLAEGEDDFADYLYEYGPNDPRWALSVLEIMLDNRGPVEPLRRGSGGGEELVRLVVRLYTDATADAAIKSRAMDALDRLMERYSYEAQHALEE
jgi:hypothetical protein